MASGEPKLSPTAGPEVETARSPEPMVAMAGEERAEHPQGAGRGPERFLDAADVGDHEDV